MRRFLLAATAAAAILFGGAAQATTWTVSTFDHPWHGRAAAVRDQRQRRHRRQQRRRRLHRHPRQRPDRQPELGRRRADRHQRQRAGGRRRHDRQLVLLPGGHLHRVLGAGCDGHGGPRHLGQRPLRHRAVHGRPLQPVRLRLGSRHVHAVDDCPLPPARTST